MVTIEGHGLGSPLRSFQGAVGTDTTLPEPVVALHACDLDGAGHEEHHVGGRRAEPRAKARSFVA